MIVLNTIHILYIKYFYLFNCTNFPKVLINENHFHYILLAVPLKLHYNLL